MKSKGYFLTHPVHTRRRVTFQSAAKSFLRDERVSDEWRVAVEGPGEVGPSRHVEVDVLLQLVHVRVRHDDLVPHLEEQLRRSCTVQVSAVADGPARRNRAVDRAWRSLW